MARVCLATFLQATKHSEANVWVRSLVRARSFASDVSLECILSGTKTVVCPTTHSDRSSAEVASALAQAARSLRSAVGTILLMGEEKDGHDSGGAEDGKSLPKVRKKSRRGTGVVRCACEISEALTR